MMSPRNSKPLDPIPSHVTIPEPDPTDLSFTYFAEDVRTGLIKIGSTYRQRLMERMRELERALGGPVALLALVSGGPKVERTYHTRFKESRDHGEWFRPSPELRDAIRLANPPVALAASWTSGARAYWGEWMDLLGAPR